jgi:hypothetical protein
MQPDHAKINDENQSTDGMMPETGACWIAAQQTDGSACLLRHTPRSS